MATLDGTIQFTGSIQNLSFYKMRGSDKIIVRTKGGPSRKQVKHSMNFENTRRNNKEFGGRARAAAHIKCILSPLLFIADYNITGPINALLRPIQKLDTESDLGKRSILITKQPRLLEGFTLNRRHLFDSIIRTPVTCNIQLGQVFIDIPDLMPGINFVAPGNYAWFQFMAVAGLVPDLYYGSYDEYMPKEDLRYLPKIASTDWLPANTIAPVQQLVINGLPEQKPESCSILVAVGVTVGIMEGGGIKPVKYVGGGKVLKMV